MLDKLDKNGNIIGQAKRSDFHGDPSLIHGVVHCWFFNSKGQILWQQRSLKKATSPGKWDMSCGGHILSGDTAEHTVIREIEEELGVKDIKPIFVDKYIEGDDYQTELINLYYAITDKNPDEFTLQEIEVEKVEWIYPFEAQKLVLEKQRESTDFIFDQVTKILVHRLND